MQEKLGLVLSGGGAKGSYEVGVWGALEELGILPEITDIVGTSVGALNAALLETKGFAEAKRLWLSLKSGDLIHLDKERITRHLTAGTPADAAAVPYELLLSGLPVTQERIGELIGEVDFGAMRRRVFAMCSKDTKHATCFCLNLFESSICRQILLASSALPVIYRGVLGVRVDGFGRYFDGGITPGNNTPIAALYERRCRHIIAVHLQGDPKLPDADTFPDAQIVHIVPHESLGGFVDGTLHLTRKKTSRNILRGYHDALALHQALSALIRKEADT